jgi:TPR repeat protein
MTMSQESQKVPSQVFRWFEKMKSNYEQNVQSVLQRFEQYSHSQQLRIDHANQSNIDNLKQSHQKLLSLQNDQINQLSHDVKYYKEEMAKQQQTIEQLNGRYDTVMSCLLTEKRKDIDIRDIFSDDDFVKSKPSECIESIESIESIEESNISNTASDEIYDEHATQNEDDSIIHDDTITPLAQCDDDLFEQAILEREQGDIEQAFQLFEQAAKLGHAKSMGAMGRSFFLGEGIEEDHSIGLAWLIHAAKQDLPQAVARVKHFQESDPDLYQEALNLAEHLNIY